MAIDTLPQFETVGEVAVHPWFVEAVKEAVNRVAWEENVSENIVWNTACELIESALSWKENISSREGSAWLQHIIFRRAFDILNAVETLEKRQREIYLEELTIVGDYLVKMQISNSVSLETYGNDKIVDIPRGKIIEDLRRFQEGKAKRGKWPNLIRSLLSRITNWKVSDGKKVGVLAKALDEAWEESEKTHSDT